MNKNENKNYEHLQPSKQEQLNASKTRNPIQKNPRIPKSVSELNLIDDFLLQHMLADPDYGVDAARLILETILERPIKNISIRTQEPFNTGNTGNRAIRLDVYIEENDDISDDEASPGAVYDIEAQSGKTNELAFRSRYYQAVIDTTLLKSGNSYKSLKPLWIIVITDTDFLKRNQMIYTFETRCVELPDLSLNDGAKRLFLNPVGHNGGNSKLKHLLKYFVNSQDKQAVDDNTQELHKLVENVRSKERIGVEWVKSWERDEENREEGRQEGLLEGRKEGLLEGRQEGLLEGRQEGLQEGKENLLYSQIQKKLEKDKTVEQIADELEQDISEVQAIIDLIQQ